MPGRRLGQHFLRSPRILRRIAELGELGPGDLVVEIGAGKGELTRFLLERAGKVIAYEIDPALVREMDPEIRENPGLSLRRSDGLKESFPSLARQWGRPVKLVANIPYLISSPLMQKLFREHDQLALAVILCQREFALRLTASPGTKNYGALTVLAGQYFDIEICFPVPPSAFTPRPRVSSSVVRLRTRAHPRHDAGNPSRFHRVVRQAFQGRRKTLLNALKPVFGPETRWILAGAGLDPGVRPDALSPEGYARLSRLLEEEKHPGGKLHSPVRKDTF